ncbi:hypothetical protein COOONC_02988 [Cooperia oncophora]
MPSSQLADHKTYELYWTLRKPRQGVLPKRITRGVSFPRAWNEQRDDPGLLPQGSFSRATPYIQPSPRPCAFQPPCSPSGHGAYGLCAQFLDYLQHNWYGGPFRDIWNKWNKQSLRTTNVAKTFNRNMEAGDAMEGRTMVR